MLDKAMKFREVALQGSFTQAAANLKMTKSQLSRIVSSLEKDLGVKLFHRTTRQLHLTDEGQQFLKTCSNIFESFDDVCAQLKNNILRPSGHIRLTTTVTVANEDVCPLLYEFYQHYPDIHISLALNDQVVDIIKEHYDLAIRYSQQLPDSSLQSRFLVKGRSILCASPRFIEQYGRPSKVSDLESLPCVTSITRDPNYPRHRWYFTKNKKKYSANINVVYAVSSHRAQMLMALTGVGVANIPLKIAQQYVNTGELIELLPNYQIPDYSLYIIYPQTHVLPQRIRVFIDFLAEKLPAAYDNAYCK